MTDQGTPGSNADTSVNGGKSGAPKDKQCPFCNVHFTSSSLGRHLDLYIKEKNPKPADGIHPADEIRKLRGGITRRQPRNSASKREDSTPVGTPGAQRSPPPESEARGIRSPSISKCPPTLPNQSTKSGFTVNKGTWESTGVMNHIPPLRNGNSAPGWDGEEREPARRAEGRNRSVSKQMLAKTTFEQKQKMMDALDNAKAAELALRELLGGIRAAKRRVDGPVIFDYDPLTFDFPSLVLHCLPPPPTLHQTNPISTSNSWSILPPDDQQYQALREHFSRQIHNWRVSCQLASTAPQDDLSYPPRPIFSHFDDPTELAQRAEIDASELETKIADHLHTVYSQWTTLTNQRRSELWTLELARSVGRKSEDVRALKKEKDVAQQEATHLRNQVDELSRLQYPREFKLSAPKTIALDSTLMNELGNIGTNMNFTSVGFNITDKNLPLDDMVDRVIGRWRGVVRDARGGTGAGLMGQRYLSGDSSFATPPIPPSQSNVAQNKSQTIIQDQGRSNITPTTNGTAEMGSDEDADADMEDDSFVEMANTSHAANQRIPDPVTMQAANFRLANGNGNSVMEGLENQNCVPGYVRIGA